jgi:hypothetical protein
MGHAARMAEIRNAYKILFRTADGKRPFGRHRGRWEDNIRMDLREIGYEDLGWIRVGQDRDQWWAVVNTVMNFRVL